MILLSVLYFHGVFTGRECRFEQRPGVRRLRHSKVAIHVLANFTDSGSARSTADHRDHRQRRATEAIGERTAGDASDGTDADRRERRQLCRTARRLCGHRHRKARLQEHADPRPHRVVLPHVAQVAEVGETQRPHAPRSEHGVTVEASRRYPVRVSRRATRARRYDGSGCRIRSPSPTRYFPYAPSVEPASVSPISRGLSDFRALPHGFDGRPQVVGGLVYPASIVLRGTPDRTRSCNPSVRSTSSSGMVLQLRRGRASARHRSS